MITLDFTKDLVEDENLTEFRLIWGEADEFIYYSPEINAFVGRIDDKFGASVRVVKSDIQPLIRALQKLEEVMEDV